MHKSLVTASENWRSQASDCLDVDLQYLTSYLVHSADGVEDINKSSLFYYAMCQFIIDKLYNPQNVQPNCWASGESDVISPQATLRSIQI